MTLDKTAGLLKRFDSQLSDAAYFHGFALAEWQDHSNLHVGEAVLNPLLKTRKKGHCHVGRD